MFLLDTTNKGFAHIDVDDLLKNEPIRIKGKRSSTHVET
jgi:hypothetical protein